MKKLRMSLLMLLTILMGMVSQGMAETVLFHIKTALDKDDAQICVAPNVALAAQNKGDQVILLFDASAVTSITKGWGKMNFGENTPMDKAKLPERERKSLSEQFNISLEEVPRNYGDYLDFLKGRGAKIYVNGTMLTLYKIDHSIVDPVADIVDLTSMLKLFKEADKILVY